MDERGVRIEAQSYWKSSSSKALLNMLPGPVIYSPTVLEMLGRPTVSHVSPEFISEFASLLKNLRILFGASEKDQPFVFSGGGTLGYEFLVTNLLLRSNYREVVPRVLLLNTGKFGDRWSKYIKALGLRLVELQSTVGHAITPEEVTEALTKNNADKDPFTAVIATHMDTSTGVRIDLGSICKIVRSQNPDTLILIDAMGSIAAETFEFTEWGIDGAIANSQKSLGAPPGLVIITVSARGIALAKEIDPPTLYLNLNSWLPIMRAYEKGEKSWFSTPNVNLTRAMNLSVQEILVNGRPALIKAHEEISSILRTGVRELGLSFVPQDSCSGNSMTAISLKCSNGESIPMSLFLDALIGEGVLAGHGTHAEVGHGYFRVGHTGYMTTTCKGREYIQFTLAAMKAALAKCKDTISKNS